MADDVDAAFLSSPQVARILGITGVGVAQLVRQGKIPGVKIANRWLIPRAFVEEFARTYQGRRGRPRKKGLPAGVPAAPAQMTAAWPGFAPSPVEAAAGLTAPAPPEAVETPAAVIAPLEVAPVEVPPVEAPAAASAPLEPAPIEVPPVEAPAAASAPLEPAPIEALPVEEPAAASAPLEPAPIEVPPVEAPAAASAPLEPAPIEVPPVEAPAVASAPLEPAPIEALPIEASVQVPPVEVLPSESGVAPPERMPASGKPETLIEPEEVDQGEAGAGFLVRAEVSHLDRNYDFEVYEKGRITDRARIIVARLKPRIPSLPRFSFRWDYRYEHLNVDIHGVEPSVVEWWTMGQNGYTGHLPRRLADKGYTFEAVIWLPVTFVFRGRLTLGLGGNSREVEEPPSVASTTGGLRRLWSRWQGKPHS